MRRLRLKLQAHIPKAQSLPLTLLPCCRPPPPARPSAGSGSGTSGQQGAARSGTMSCCVCGADDFAEGWQLWDDHPAQRHWEVLKDLGSGALSQVSTCGVPGCMHAQADVHGMLPSCPAAAASCRRCLGVLMHTCLAHLFCCHVRRASECDPHLLQQRQNQPVCAGCAGPAPSHWRARRPQGARSPLLVTLLLHTKPSGPCRTKTGGA